MRRRRHGTRHIHKMTATTKVDSCPMQCCSVCDFRGKVSRNFGATTCSPCAAFFRRTVGLKIRYVCKYANNCSVALEIRNGCRSCRYQKCESAGMNRKSVVSKGERDHRLPEYIRKGRENGETEVVRGFASSIYHNRLDSRAENGSVSPTPSWTSSNGSNSSVSTILDVTPEELLNYYVVRMKELVSYNQFKDGFGSDTSLQMFLQIKYAGDQNAWNICSNCPGADLLSEEDMQVLQRYCSFSNVWMDSAWMKTAEASDLKLASTGPSSKDPHLHSVISNFNSIISPSMSRLQLDIVEYSALKALCIWKLGLVDSTLTFKIVAQEQYYGISQALTLYYRSEKRRMGEMEIAVRIADLTLLLGPIFESYCTVMRFYKTLA